MYPDYVQVEMPSVYSQADAAWIQQQLQQLPSTLRQKATLSYAEVYQQAFDAEPVSYRQGNRGQDTTPFVRQKVPHSGYGAD